MSDKFTSQSSCCELHPPLFRNTIAENDGFVSHNIPNVKRKFSILQTIPHSQQSSNVKASTQNIRDASL